MNPSETRAERDNTLRLLLPAAVVDRRFRHRYPLALELSYKVGGSPFLRSGRTRNISSNGVLFQSYEAGKMGCLIVLTMHWPVLLDDLCPLNLVMTGHVVRVEGDMVAVQVYSHEFRTSKRSGEIARLELLPAAAFAADAFRSQSARPRPA